MIFKKFSTLLLLTTILIESIQPASAMTPKTCLGVGIYQMSVAAVGVATAGSVYLYGVMSYACPEGFYHNPESTMGSAFKSYCINDNGDTDFVVHQEDKFSPIAWKILVGTAGAVALPYVANCVWVCGKKVKKLFESNAPVLPVVNAPELPVAAVTADAEVANLSCIIAMDPISSEVAAQQVE